MPSQTRSTIRFVLSKPRLGVHFVQDLWVLQLGRGELQTDWAAIVYRQTAHDFADELGVPILACVGSLSLARSGPVWKSRRANTLSNSRGV